MQDLYPFLLKTHSVLRFAVLALLLWVIIKGLSGWFGKKTFEKSDEKPPLFLLISAHIQLLLGFALYFVSPWVRFGAGVMKEKLYRYWTVEHISLMIIAIVLITIGKSSLKRLTTAEAKYKRMAIFNIIALILIIVAILMSQRGLFTISAQ